MSEDSRIETDSLGQVPVPADALYGAQTQRAVDNFPISGQRFGRRMIQALGMVKQAAALTNRELGNLEGPVADAIARAAAEVADGKWDREFVVDVYQTGSGTSSNMNANEVMARLATGFLEGSHAAVHPIDQVNFGQSSNDVIPTAIHIAARLTLERDLIPALESLHEELAAKASEFDGLVKSGRTHLMDATPVRLGQEFGGMKPSSRRGSVGSERRRRSWPSWPSGERRPGPGSTRTSNSRRARSLGSQSRRAFRSAKQGTISRRRALAILW